MRLIAKLEVKPPYVVKPIHFEGLRKIGSSESSTKRCVEFGFDEIIYNDIVASLYQREILFSEINNATKDVFVPVTVGGGIRSIRDCFTLFRSGADKVSINSYALQENPSIIEEIAHLYGSQSLVVNVEAKRVGSTWVCYSDCGRIPSNRSVFDWVKEASERGAGEILLQSVDRDGTRSGFDIDLIAGVVERVNIPVIASSGAGSTKHIKDLLETVRPSAIALSSIIHYCPEMISEIREQLQNFEVVA